VPSYHSTALFLLSFIFILSFHLFTMRSFSSLLTLAIALPALVAGELSGKVGPTTSHATKAAKKTCDITKYGAIADGKTDISTALNSAFTACKTGGVVVIPTGNYAMSKWVKLAGGNGWALQLNGIITRTGTDGGNMIMIEHSNE
jgi:rhamnogalacturonan hydrolase